VSALCLIFGFNALFRHYPGKRKMNGKNSENNQAESLLFK
jgi:hypothetical protein